MLFSALKQVHCVHVACDIHQSGVLMAPFDGSIADAMWNRCVKLGASSVYTLQLCTSLQCHFIQSHIGMVALCLAVTCYPHFWQNDWDLSHATAVIQGWNRYWNKSLQIKFTPEKKIVPLFLQGLKPWPSEHESNALTTKLSLLLGIQTSICAHNICSQECTHNLSSQEWSALVCQKPCLHKKPLKWFWIQTEWGDFADWQATNSRQMEWWNRQSADQQISNHV